MIRHLLAHQRFDDTTVVYQLNPEDGTCGLLLVPRDMEARICDHESALDSLVHLKVIGDDYAEGFSQGRTLRNGPSVKALTFQEQVVENLESGTLIRTFLSHPSGLHLEHRLLNPSHGQGFLVETLVENRSGEKVTLEMLSSFSLGGLSPFHPDGAPEQLFAHRFLSTWSSEGRHEVRSLEEHHLEPSWSHHSFQNLRFGQVGSMPVRGTFPFAAIEDRQTGVFWGAQLAHPGSWQMEIFRRDEKVVLSGGQADREFGHWMKDLEPGQSFISPRAHLACSNLGFEDLCHRLTHLHREGWQPPSREESLPVQFNEWCTTWGHPQHDRLLQLAAALPQAAIRYLIIDAGWYKKDGTEWWCGQGDWRPNSGLFPDGLQSTADAIRQLGFEPGIWFELEVVGRNSDIFESHVEHFLHRDGVPITTHNKRF